MGEILPGNCAPSVHTTLKVMVVVHVHHARGRDGSLCDLVGVVGSGKSGADVEELLHTVIGREVVDCTLEELPRGTREQRHVRDNLQDLLTDLPVHGKMVFAAQPVVPDPG